MQTTDYAHSLTLAEAACLNFIAPLLGLETGRDAFLSVNPGSPDCAVFDIGHAYTGDLNTFRSEYVHMRAQLDLYRRDRAWIQRAVMTLRAKLPSDADGGEDGGLHDGSNVVQLRLAPETGNPSAVTTAEIPLATDAKAVRTFACSLTFDVVFLCGRP